jgi:RNA polymerase sigma factor (TIGR02999 family)
MDCGGTDGIVGSVGISISGLHHLTRWDDSVDRLRVLYSSSPFRLKAHMTSTSRDEITLLLHEWRNGDRAALDKLVPVVYRELRRLASHYMNNERPDHTLQATALVSEAYLRLVDYQKMQWQNRAHFMAVAAQAMRRILVDHARSHQYAKRGGGAQTLSLEDAPILCPEPPPDILALDEAMQELESMDPRKCRIVEFKFFGGLSTEETAEVLVISTATVEREWRAAKAWLYRTMTEGKS